MVEGTNNQISVVVKPYIQDALDAAAALETILLKKRSKRASKKTCHNSEVDPVQLNTEH